MVWMNTLENRFADNIETEPGADMTSRLPIATGLYIY